MNIGNNLQSLRSKRNLSQEALAEEMGVSRQAVAKWEQGQSCPELPTLLALADFYSVTVDQLVRTPDYPESIPAGTLDERIQFLLEAKKNGYAAKAKEEPSSRPNSHDIHYQRGDWLYIDSYLGGEKFTGEEALWHRGTPQWAMNYSGRVFGPNFSGDFLKEALSLVPEEKPFRGPAVHTKGEYSYHSMVQGNFSWFQGYEEILYGKERVYQCFYHGGEVL